MIAHHVQYWTKCQTAPGRDIAYGSEPLQKLDVFTPDGARGKKLPVLLFVHGGGFRRGDKHGDFYPDNITLWAAKNGMVGVNIDYRLAPQDPWPADLGSASGQITRLTTSPYPLFYGYAEFDPPMLKATAAALIEGLCHTKSRCHKSVELKDSNHFSEGMAVGTPDQQLTGPLLQWIKALPAEFRISACDARFIAVAKQLRVKLVTADTKLRAAVPTWTVSLEDAA